MTYEGRGPFRCVVAWMGAEMGGNVAGVQMGAEGGE